jgi:7-cyano-7-deazaguanine synthase
MEKPNALLLSGGIDSLCAAYLIRPDQAITIKYGQSSETTEARVSARICSELNIIHHIIDVNCRDLGCGDLVGRDSIIESPSSEWWPFRNQLLLTLAGMKALSLGIRSLVTASVSCDDFHKDGTAEFYQLSNNLMALQEGNIRVEAPFLSLTSAQLVQKSRIPKSLLLFAHSCHKSNIPCNNCRGCNKYFRTMVDNGIF